MEYYSKLNMEVEKSKIHSEWKIKRLQLDKSRVQLLSTEERNLKREKLEIEHRKNEEIMAMSIQSFEDNQQDQDSETVIDNDEIQPVTNQSKENNEKHVKESNQVFNAIYNVARSFFGRKNVGESKCDNQLELDPQGNIIKTDSENNANVENYNQDLVDANQEPQVDNNNEFIKTRLDALKNKDRAKAHVCFDEVTDNDYLKSSTSRTSLVKVDADNNIQTNTDASSAFEEAKRNKIKVLGAEFNIIDIENERKYKGPRTEEQKQAILNKQKVLGVEYNLESPVIIKEPVNEAQEEAIRNKIKILGSDSCYNQQSESKLSPKKQMVKKSGLTLDLKPYDGNVCLPSTGGTTPAEFHQVRYIINTCI